MESSNDIPTHSMAMLIMPWMPQINSVLKPLGLLFNPRTYKGCDPSPPSVPCLPLSFQSTHPRGVRRVGDVVANPKLLVSIHAPTRGATESCKKSHKKDIVSIHAPTRGATNCICCHSYNDVSFNPRTHEGCDTHQRRHQRTRLTVSIHAPTRGATHLSVESFSALV